MKTTSLVRGVAVFLSFWALVGCQSTTTIPIPSPFRAERVERQAGLSPKERTWLEKNCYAGEPKLMTPPEGFNRTISRAGYALNHSSFYRQPLWVAEGLSRQELSGPGNRDLSKFKADEKLPVAERSEPKDYKKSGFDQGHMAPAGDFNRSQAATDESFFMSNMSPQIGPGFNRAIWSYLEDLARELISGADSGYVLTGPMFIDPKEEDPETADGLVPVTWVKQRVAVPTHYYKIVVTLRERKASCVAFVLENKSYDMPKRDIRFSEFVKSVDWVEARTGINFMPDLPPNLERQLERDVGAFP
ncbi:MAG: DNA/RNA non-specific endonuclease [Opitutaceae bacterium]|nr:DNA/RNA non-specific endonuclease [Opitutaceae bacterium]